MKDSEVNDEKYPRNGAVPKNKKTVEALGIRKLHQVVEKPDNDAVRGMIHQVKHLVKVEEIN